jgi:hypothetical protein
MTNNKSAQIQGIAFLIAVALWIIFAVAVQDWGWGKSAIFLFIIPITGAFMFGKTAGWRIALPGLVLVLSVLTWLALGLFASEWDYWWLMFAGPLVSIIQEIANAGKKGA